MNKIDKKTLAYVIGVAIGDGNLSNPNGRAVRLRITCDSRYEKLLGRICAAIKKLLPENKVSIVKRTKTYVDISCYSNKWEDWLGWRSGKGPKFRQKVHIPDWILNNKKFSIECLRGLLETDGSVYVDRGYTMVNFVTTIPALGKDVEKIINALKFTAHSYKIETSHKTRYNIRISRNVNEFIKLIGLEKN